MTKEDINNLRGKFILSFIIEVEYFIKVLQVSRDIQGDSVS